MLLDCSNALSTLVHLQNEDGGWSYGRGSSWTEPTAYVLLALRAAGQTDRPFARGLAFLEKLQRQDGGWPPHVSVDESTWVTAIALLAMAGHLKPGSLDSARRWLLAQSGRESGYIQRIRNWMLGVRVDEDLTHNGWPWYPGAAAWVTTTALTILALEKAARLRPDAQSHARIETGRKFLLARACKDGGWNHGSTRALGYDVGSYPETTGLALLALHAASGPAIGKGVERAEQYLSVCRSAGARSWLCLGLRAHGRSSPAPETAPVLRTPIDTALYVLAQTEKGIGVFLS
jgi:hypothetical protein